MGTSGFSLMSLTVTEMRDGARLVSLISPVATVLGQTTLQLS